MPEVLYDIIGIYVWLCSSICIQVICMYENIYIHVKIDNWKICVDFFLVNMFNKVKLYSNFFIQQMSEYLAIYSSLSQRRSMEEQTDKDEWNLVPLWKWKTSTET